MAGILMLIMITMTKQMMFTILILEMRMKTTAVKIIIVTKYTEPGHNFTKTVDIWMSHISIIAPYNGMMMSSNGNIFRGTGPLWGKPTVTIGFPSERPVTRCLEVFLDLRLNKWLCKQSKRRWFETPLHSLWRHYNEILILTRSMECIICYEWYNKKAHMNIKIIDTIFLYIWFNLYTYMNWSGYIWKRYLYV